MLPYSNKDSTIEGFYSLIEREFCRDSAINVDLFRRAVAVVQDTEISQGHEVDYPIHRALNWNVVRFGAQCRENLFAALFLNEDGTAWQAKLSRPRLDIKRTRKELERKLGCPIQLSEVKTSSLMRSCCPVYQKYETPVGAGSRAYLPNIDFATRLKVAERWGLEPPPMTESFWKWVEAHPEIEVSLTEGGKKALSLLSHGYVAIALYGVNGGYQRRLGDLRELISDLLPFAVADRPFLLAFDEDELPKTRTRVSIAQFRLGLLLQAKQATVRVAAWRSLQGKGVDDLIVQSGLAAWQHCATTAMLLSHWQILQRLERRLTHQPNLTVETIDMSQAGIQLPDSGLIGVVGAKGTGKTKLIAEAISDQDKVISAGHRIALQRQMCERLRLNYIGDVDKAQGQFIAGGAYTMRLGLCVDSLLAIDPAQFAGCDLIGDEWTQVLRHLLTSSTCAKDGKRPALLAILKALVRVARRVIVADADLDDESLRYLQALKGDNTPIFLVKNNYQGSGYPVRFIDSPDRSAIVTQLIKSVCGLKPGEAEFIATDSKATSKMLACLIQQQDPSLKILLLNSETISGQMESQFNRQPDLWLAEAVRQGWRVLVIASPTLVTGSSMELRRIFQRVWGIFMGVSSTDADLSQALSRVREPVERVVWCARRGTNFSAIGRSTNPHELTTLLRSKTNATVRLIRSNLSEDIADELGQYSWDNDPHVRLYCQIAAEQNRSMAALRDSLLVRLKYEGNQVVVETPESSRAMRLLLGQIKSELRELEAEKIASARILSVTERLQFEGIDGLDEADLLAVRRFDLCDFFVIEPTKLTVEFVLADREGRRRSELLHLENQQHPGLSVDRSVKAIEKQAIWKQGYSVWDIPNTELRRVMRNLIGVNELLNIEREWTKYDLAEYAERARSMVLEIKSTLNFSISDAISDTHILHYMLSQLGVKVTFRWSRSVEGHEGEKLRVYSLDKEQWQDSQQILLRREAKRRGYACEDQPHSENPDCFGSPPLLNTTILPSDPSDSPAEQLEAGNHEVLAVTASNKSHQLAAAKTNPSTA